MSDDKELTQDERVALMDAQVALNRETNHRSGGNDVEPGQYEAVEIVPEPVREEHPNEATADVVAAMDAQVAAAHGGPAVGMSTGVETSAKSEPAKSETKAPARAKSK